MSSFSLHIATDNAAFDAGNLPDELARILRRLASALDHGPIVDAGVEIDRNDRRYGANEGTVRDENGNTCGRWFWTDRDQRLDDAAALELTAHALDKGTDPSIAPDLLEQIAITVRATGRETRA